MAGERRTKGIGRIPKTINSVTGVPLSHELAYKLWCEADPSKRGATAFHQHLQASGWDMPQTQVKWWIKHHRFAERWRLLCLERKQAVIDHIEVARAHITLKLEGVRDMTDAVDACNAMATSAVELTKAVTKALAEIKITSIADADAVTKIAERLARTSADLKTNVVGVASMMQHLPTQAPQEPAADGKAESAPSAEGTPAPAQPAVAATPALDALMSQLKGQGVH